ncbi:MAG: hypothetical protein Q8K75_05405 [Chlamydiales bacterium]|nr:hypothetical protein [Chlamydiales bacterium]
MKLYWLVLVSIVTALMLCVTTTPVHAETIVINIPKNFQSFHFSHTSSSRVSASASAQSFGGGWGYGGWGGYGSWNWGVTGYGWPYYPSGYGWGGYDMMNYGYSEVYRTEGYNPWRFPKTNFSMQKNNIRHLYPKDAKEHPIVP